MIIGIGYRARAGKDTVAEYLCQCHGFRRFAFADKLKEVCGLLTNEDPYDPEFKGSMTSLGFTGGQLLQRVGVALRGVDESFWIKALGLTELQSFYPRIVIPDCRFVNEARHIKNLGGVLIQVHRPGLPQDLHVSETEGSLITWDHTIVNNGSIDDLCQRTNDYVTALLAADAQPSCV